ncbi:MAG TPA: ribonuclease P protein component [Planctomycetes bacterium]|nr:ribonuclease P protein component [Planctomycetota bacterium]
MNETPPPARLRFSLRRHRMGPKDFARVYREGSRARGSLMTVALCTNGLGHTRLGLSVGKRCWKSAVKRNRVRRVFREAFRLSLPELPSGLDVVLIASTPQLKPTLEPTRRELVKMVRKAHRRFLEKREQG